VLFDESDHIACLATAETLIYALGLRHIERRRFFVVKRTIGYVVGASFAEFDELTEDIDYIGAVHYFLYGCRCDHVMQM
jgi:hypothetical protein